MFQADRSQSDSAFRNEILATKTSSRSDWKMEYATCDETSSFVIVERNQFLHGCMAHCLANQLPGDVAAVASLSVLTQAPFCAEKAVVLLSVLSLSEEEADAEIALLTEITSVARSLVLARTDDLQQALTVLGLGGSGYITTSAGFDACVQALRFVIV